MAIRYKITLTAEERTELEEILKKGRYSSLEFRNAGGLCQLVAPVACKQDGGIAIRRQRFS